MSTRRVTLRCLIHPVTLLSIGLLLVNDHWLKAEFPSWWTGKLSDFAGLFFFPFLLAPLFGLLLDWKNISPVTAGKIAFGLTATWFASFKTMPLVNAATCALLTALLGHPVQLVLDPTDLIAVPMLVPAWLLWARETRHDEYRPGKLAWLALAAGVLATAASTNPPEPYIIQRLAVEDGKLYAFGSFRSPDESGSFKLTAVSEPVASSADNGRTWQSVPRKNSLASFSSQATREACDPGNAEICYRILPEQVEASYDGGKTYQVAWSIPWGRRLYMERENLGTGLRQPKSMLLGPYDLIFMPPIGANRLSTVVFAMGNEGILVRAPEGTWERRAVETSKPTPFAARDIFGALDTLPFEIDAVAYLAMLAFSFLSFRIGSTFERRWSGSHSVLWAIWPLVVLDIVVLLGWGAWAWNGTYRLGAFFLLIVPFFTVLSGPFPQFLVVPLLFIILPGMGIIWTWKQIARLPPKRDVAIAFFWRTVRFTIALALLTFMPLALWAFGIIPLYELALAMAILVGAVVIRIGIKSVPGELPPPEAQPV